MVVIGVGRAEPTMEQVWQILQSRSVLGVSILRFCDFLAVTIGLFVILQIVTSIVRKRVVARAARTGRPADAYVVRLLERTWSLTLLAATALAALGLVDLHPTFAAAPGRVDLHRLVWTVALLVLFLQAGRWGTSLIDTALEQGLRFARFPEAAAQSALGVVRAFALAALWISVAILVLGTLGIEVTPLLAGLGIGGIAVGFALQRILGDLFCSVAIVLDRPFEVGDFIQAGEFQGTVERIGIRTTRMRSLGGEEIIFPNAELLQSRIRNFRRMTERRVALRFGVAHGTPAETLERIPGLLRAIIEGLERTRFDHAHLTSFGETGPIFEAVYYVLDPDSNLALDIQQRVNLALVRAMEGLDVRLAVAKP
jgi:small-conductance mechanosensitive channel